MSELRTENSGMSHIVNSGPVSIGAYCFSSILMTVTNKFVVSGDKFNMNFVMLFVQALVCTLCLAVLKMLGYAKFRPLNKTDVKNWFPISLLLVAMIYTSSKALQHLAVPIYTIFKNLTIILIAYGEVLFFGGSVSAMELSAFVVMVLSSVVATMGDQQDLSAKTANQAQSATEGYVWMFTNCIASALFVLIMRKRIKLTNFKDYDTMFYNNILALPVLLISSIALEDWSPANLTTTFTNEFLTALVISGLASVGISYCSGWCVRVTSSTTYSMVGALNKLPIALSGLIFFDAPKNFLSIFSIFLGFLAGLIYVVAKQKKQQKQKPQPPKV
ncbi:LANO_0D01376g1_1 [Lachancea nothofagi CBS 11611]|uniref:GDP-mannose transporter n=1 Tax=Lachancea nothofagi CBS 11611 TaxID=1266666 RepID=A0A1G4JDD0_9SACH|nr:LANO_0D01376g1_1 [Lachancea nothofagi CBS 11611]